LEIEFTAMKSTRSLKKLKKHRTTQSILLGTLAAAALPFTASTVQAEEAAAAAATPPPPPSKVNVLLNFEFADKYLTPRGMIVQNEGVVFQPLLLGFANLYSGEKVDFLNSVTLVGGVWNCFGTGGLPSSDSNGAEETSWYEIDPIAGLSFGLMQGFTLDVTYTAFNMEVFNIPFSQHLETKLSFDDSPYLKAFALHPYVILWNELDGKAVANTDADPESSYYFDIGVAPSYTFGEGGVKLEAPCRMLLANEDFYGTGAGDASTVGLWEVGLKASMPLKCMPAGYGNWSVHAGFKYMDFVDDNLIATQGQSDTWQAFAGISTFF
jgi:hypothetical protein